MQFWMEKGSTASEGSGSGSLHFDETLSYLKKRNDGLASDITSNSSSNLGFRTSGKQKAPHAIPTNAFQPLFDDYSNTIPEDYSSPIYQQFTQPVTAYARCYLPTYRQENVVDGSEILYLLNTSDYTDLVYDEELDTSTKEFHSYRHQLDKQHALSEKEKVQHQWTTALLSSEDIVEYLTKTVYSDDIYGIPILGELVREAKAEINNTDNNNSEHNNVAVERLSMIRNHLVAKAKGDTDMAAKNALTMSTTDWSALFS